MADVDKWVHRIGTTYPERFYGYGPVSVTMCGKRYANGRDGGQVWLQFRTGPPSNEHLFDGTPAKVTDDPDQVTCPTCKSKGKPPAAGTPGVVALPPSMFNEMDGTLEGV